ncbi:MAG: BON domain-containing protein [Elusimicrobia bacterium]|nr:BON domain-containing protein [Elusimicrobiota bacterium]
MRNNRVLMIAVWMIMITAFLGSGACRTQKAADIPDAAIRDAVIRSLQDDDVVSPHRIDVQVLNGVVAFSGFVSSMLEKEQAVRVAESIKGVKAIIDHCRVRPVERTDEEIKQDIVQALKNNLVTATQALDITVQNSAVTITGTVGSWQEKEASINVVKSVQGIASLTEHVAIQYETERTEDEIVPEIKQRLAYDPYINEDLISVEIDNSTVTLHGTVGSRFEKKRIIARSYVYGVYDVVADRVTVYPRLNDPMKKKSYQQHVGDKDIRTALILAFSYDPYVDSGDITVSVADGVVRLSGTVEHRRSKHAAVKNAYNTLGVTRVTDEIAVRPPDLYTDTQITDTVTMLIRLDAILERFDLVVWSRNNNVYLNGTVDTFYEKKRAEQIADGVRGVVDVTNHINVDYTVNKTTDREIFDAIRWHLSWNPLVDGEEIDVTVEDATVLLSGSVSSWKERAAAVKSAFAGGAEQVKDRMVVMGWDASSVDNDYTVLDSHIYF